MPTSDMCHQIESLSKHERKEGGEIPRNVRIAYMITIRCDAHWKILLGHFNFIYVNSIWRAKIFL